MLCVGEMQCSLLFSLLLLGVANGGLLGDTECTYGPSYWCHSLENAKQCSAVNHCIQTVWENLVLPEDNDEICGICKDMVKQARDVLESNETQMELKQVFEGSCRLIPLREISEECVTLADEFIPELIETLSSQMNPQVVCATAGLCNNHRVDRLLVEHGLLPKGELDQDQNYVATPVAVGDTCNDCNTFMKDLVDTVRQNSKQEVMDHLLAICGELGSISDGCSALVTVNIDGIYEYLSNDIDPSQLCDLFDMCEGKFKLHVATIEGDETCDFCVVIAQHWRDMLVSNSSEVEFREVLEGICRQTGSFASECKGLVDNYAVPLYNFLMDNYDPKAICEVVGLCSGTFKSKPIWTTLHVDSVPADTELSPENTMESDLPLSQQFVPSLHFVGSDEANYYRGQHGPVPSIKVTVTGESGVIADKNDQLCTMCEFTLHFIQIQLQDQHTRESIEHAVKNVCNLLPGDLKEQCGDYIDAYGDQVIALLQQEIDPSIMCPMLGLCPKVDSTTDIVPIKEAVTCVACEFVMKKVKDILVDRRDEEAVRDALDTVCAILPHSFSSQCQTFVDQNAVEVMQLLAAGVDPEQICKLLNFCKDQHAGLAPLSGANQLPIGRLFRPTLTASDLLNRRPISPVESTGQSKVCVVCEMVMITLERLILDNSTHIEDDVQRGMDLVCLHLPSTIQEDCLGFVDQYSRALIELMVAKATPQTVCRDIELCQAPSLHTMSVMAEEPVSDERSCLVCKAVATTAAGSRRQELGEQGEADALKTLCDNLSGGERMLCLRLIEHSFIPYLSKTQQCTDLGHCAQQALHLVGSEKCTWGPGYWCKSQLHAQACGAISHCQDKVWLGGAPPS